MGIGAAGNESVLGSGARGIHWHVCPRRLSTKTGVWQWPGPQPWARNACGGRRNIWSGHERRTADACAHTCALSQSTEQHDRTEPIQLSLSAALRSSRAHCLKSLWRYCGGMNPVWTMQLADLYARSGYLLSFYMDHMTCDVKRERPRWRTRCSLCTWHRRSKLVITELLLMIFHIEISYIAFIVTN